MNATVVLYDTMQQDVPTNLLVTTIKREHPHLSEETIRCRIDALLQWMATLPLARKDGKTFQMIETVDVAWHAFILHTRQYADFCAKFFGNFIHHDPPENYDEDRTADAQYTLARISNEFGNQLNPELKNLLSDDVKCCSRHE